ncbi:hypothetical protein [Halomicrobium sp. LC1Hm]|nr:hypothetical protein [Halomicrobium sp. LC1Hm]
MAEQSERLERLLTRELGECCAGDIEDRVVALFDEVEEALDR